jgi:hypothetical protein
MPLTQHEIDQIAAATAIAITASHVCPFDKEEQESLHGLGRALKAHKAGEKELFVVIQIGKNVTDFVERAGKAIIWVLIIGGAAILVSGVLPWKFWR